MSERRQTRDGALTREAIIDAAVRLADREGLEAVTLRRLAAELDVTPMPLYRHVRDKQALLAALRDRMLSQIELPPHGGGSGWAQEIREVLLATLDALRRYPALAPLALDGMLDSDAGLMLCERLLGLLTQAGFAPDEAVRLSPFISSAVVSLATTRPVESNPLVGAQFEKRERPELGHLTLLDPARFPTLRRLVGTAPSFDDPAGLATCVNVLVLGLQALATTQSR